MSFPGSLPELKGTTAKRDMEGEHNSIENRPETAAKKLKTSYAVSKSLNVFSFHFDFNVIYCQT